MTHSPTYHLIYLRSDSVLLSRHPYPDWRAIQEEYPDYMSSLNFHSLDELVDYLSTDQKLAESKIRRAILEIQQEGRHTIELSWD